MPQKKVDQRIRTLIENSIKQNTRSLFVIIGDRGKDQIVNLHYILSKSQVKARPSVLWCYKKELGFSTHKKKRMKQIKKMISRGLYDPENDNPFDLFISSTDIRWCYYKESHKILGQTYGMCVLQDFEALTPNLLCRTIETVEGGGMIVLLLRTMTSLRQLYTMTMDSHARFRTEAHSDVVARFNERFILSLSNCEGCVILDELTILPLSKSITHIKPLIQADPNNSKTPQQLELEQLKQSLKGSEHLEVLVNLTKTLDQAKALLLFIEAIAEKTLRSTVALTAARGRGKSASLGLSIAGAVAHGYSNIFVTAPTPENLNTLFQFILEGFNVLCYKEHTDYEVIQSTNPDYHNAIVRINIYHTHRQTIQYIIPSDYEKLAQAELVVVDEAAAIPLPMVKRLIGPYLVFLSSTVTGYEGTGRALSLKLINQLRQNQITDSRIFKEIQLNEPIRYNLNDPIEKWLNNLLCLDATSKAYRLTRGLPHPSQCELYYINRDALFSYHKISEELLYKMMSLYVSSHYKNSPNDLQLLSDAPAHRLFALLGNINNDSNNNNGKDILPDILCVIQVCLEGEINSDTVKSQLLKGEKSAGDLIPWTVSQQFQDNDFPTLSGARIIRIATHPDCISQGYGARALELLQKYYQGEIRGFDINGKDNSNSDEYIETVKQEPLPSTSVLQTEELKPRSKLPPLLVALKDRPPEKLHWIGVAYGLTSELFKFWAVKGGYSPVYIRLTPNELTGEHSCIMIKPLDINNNNDDDDIVVIPNMPQKGWLMPFVSDFQKRFLSLLAYECKEFSSRLSTMLLDESLRINVSDKDTYQQRLNQIQLNNENLNLFFSLHDIKRLESYSKNLVDYHMIVDLLPTLGRLYFLGMIPGMSNLSYLQKAILVGQGLQHKSVDELSLEHDIPVSQILAMFNKSIRKFVTALYAINRKSLIEEIEKTELNSENRTKDMKPLPESLDKELDKEEVEMNHKILEQMNLSEYELKGSKSDWEKGIKSSFETGVVSIKTNAPKVHVQTPDNNSKAMKRKGKESKHQSKKSKK